MAETYLDRLCALAARHDIPAIDLKLLIEDAYGKPTSQPEEKEAEHALRKLAKLKISVRELNILFGYHVITSTGKGNDENSCTTIVGCTKLRAARR